MGCRDACGKVGVDGLRAAPFRDAILNAKLESSQSLCRMYTNQERKRVEKGSRVHEVLA
jgi:hypothetical protein